MMSESLNTNEFSFSFCFVWRCFKVLSELVGRHNTTQLNGNFDGLFIQKILT